MKISTFALIALTTLFLSAFAATNVQAQFGTLFTVSHNGDTNDAAVGDGFCADSNGNCTLRAAVQEANANPMFLDGINFSLPAGSTIDLTLGELTLSSHIYIAGPGARRLTVQRSPAAGTADFRIFKVQSANTFPYPTTIRGLSIKNGKTTSDGGAVFVDYGSVLQLTEVAVTNNMSASGAIFSAGVLYVTRSLVSSNIGTGSFGGGITHINPQGTSIISNSTITNNAGIQGGGIYNTGSLLLINDTISHNTATAAGSSVMNDSNGTVNVFNTIIGMDIATSTSSLSGAFTSLGNNLITDARNSTGFTNGTNGDQVSNSNAINPLLGVLADNGGQTDTRALLDGSPAVNAGNSCVYNGNCTQSPIPQSFRLSTDQRRNNLRLGGSAVDIGAFEYGANGFIANFTLGTFGSNNRTGGALAILTVGSTNQKQTRISNPFGNHRFPNLPFGEVVFLELKPKRANQRQGLVVIEQDNLLILQAPLMPALEKQGIQITLSK
ncbi:MAG TPA: choice-of-anchor Q domain-containing protein [Pyrinomonadaceae bacterium]|nr:choice-of-anchor Q domain-containing protein [Pyrinomonadaceae bacterium]